MKMKKLISMGLAALMAVSAMSISTLAADNSSFDEQTFKDVSHEAIYHYITERESDYYTISDVSFEDGEVNYEPDAIVIETTATIHHVLKASNVEELPYVKGYLKAVGLNSFIHSSENKKLSAISSTLGKDTNTLKINQIISKINAKLDDLGEYIGKETTITIPFYVSISPECIITEDSINLSCLDDLNNIVSTDEYNLPSYESMYKTGAAAMISTINETVSDVVPMSYIDNWSNYNRISARNYAWDWWGPTDDYYNPAYNNYNNDGGDCANFVSQCILAGGVPTHGGWYKDSTAWVNANGLRTNMVQYGYATKEDAWETTAGNFAYTSSGSGHIVLVTLNDTVTLAYTAHNNNRYNQAFTNSQINGGYLFYVIKNY